jgi:uncharacterized protein (DUF362 family)
MNDKCSRREFLERTITGAVGLSASLLFGFGKKGTAFSNETEAVTRASPLANVVAVGSGGSPRENALAALHLLGGMPTFVKPGSVVVIKPNISWDRRPEQAATTNPDVVAAVVEECLKAGAKKVRIFDRALNDPRRTYRNSGIAKAAQDAGAEVFFPRDYDYVEVEFPRARRLKGWPLHREVLAADVFINLPIAKDHNEAKLTMCMKNLMGIMGGRRGSIHQGLHQNLADLNSGFVPHLNILDANRIQVAHGPNASLLADVREPKMVIAGVNAVSVDAYAAANLPWERDFGGVVEYIQYAGQMGLGEADLSKLEVRK